MILRPSPLRTPPDRLPYLRAVVAGQSYVCRVPSLLTLAQVSKALHPEKTVDPIASLVSRFGAGLSLASALAAVQEGGEETVGVLGALLGMSWADPAWELETPKPSTWTAESLQAFGSAVYEELYEAGWSLQQEISLAFGILGHLLQASRVEQEVLDQARFFAVPRAIMPSETSKPNVPSSEPSEGDGSPT